MYLKAYLRPVEARKPASALPSEYTNLQAAYHGPPRLVWFGHSSYLIQTSGLNVLVDPVLSGNASPVSFFGKSYPGSNVYSVDDLPAIDVLILTHDHYDHLDYKTVSQLRPKVKSVVTSLGVGAHLEAWGYSASCIQELDWHEEARVGTLKVRAVPARHFSGRKLTRNQTLWSSFILQTPDLNLYLGGDSGYDTHFKEIGDEYGPFDGAILECGQYNEFWKYIHMMPEDTVQAALDLRADILLPVHWGKFTLALHPWHEPIERVVQKATERGVPLQTPFIGQPMEIGKEYPKKAWWR
jgi:L-ascorbate metabolism protein UlaG (beta-lactamase superfamily)